MHAFYLTVRTSSASRIAAFSYLSTYLWRIEWASYAEAVVQVRMVNVVVLISAEEPGPWLRTGWPEFANPVELLKV